MGHGVAGSRVVRIAVARLTAQLMASAEASGFKHAAVGGHGKDVGGELHGGVALGAAA